MLCLPRHLHFEAHKVLRLPRNPHFEVQPATTSARRGSQSAVAATKSALQGPQSTAPATKSALFKVHKVLHLPQNLHSSRSTKYCTCHKICTLQGPQSTAPATKPANEPHPKLTIHCTCHDWSASKIATMSKVLRLPRNLHYRSDPLHLSRNVDFGPPKHELSRVPATKSDHYVRKCHNESAVATSTRRGHPDSASLHSRSALRGFRGMHVL